MVVVTRSTPYASVPVSDKVCVLLLLVFRALFAVVLVVSCHYYFGCFFAISLNPVCLFWSLTKMCSLLFASSVCLSFCSVLFFDGVKANEQEVADAESSLHVPEKGHGVGEVVVPDGTARKRKQRKKSTKDK